MLYLIILSLSLIHPNKALAWSQPDFKSCDFYLDAESSMECHDRGSTYLLDYGFFYCKKFKEKSLTWSVPAANWANFTGQCLQEMLFDNKQNRITSCKQLEEFAFDSHPICYKQYGFCNLDVKDKFQILSTVRAIDLISRKSLSQSLNILLACGADLWIPAEDATFHELANITRSHSRSEKEIGEEFFTSAPTASKELRDKYFRKILSLLLGMDAQGENSPELSEYLSQFTNQTPLENRKLLKRVNPSHRAHSPTTLPASKLKEILDAVTKSSNG